MTPQDKRALPLILGGIVLIFAVWILGLWVLGTYQDKFTQMHRDAGAQADAQATPQEAAEEAQIERDNFRLQEWYDGYNEAYFLNALPRATAVFGDPGTGSMGVTFQGEDEKGHVGIYIVVSQFWNPSPKEVRITLLHEMCHVELIHAPLFDDHGAEWEACMHRLADKGAFDGLW